MTLICSSPSLRSTGYTLRVHIFWRSSWKRLRQWLNRVAFKKDHYSPPKLHRWYFPADLLNHLVYHTLCGPDLLNSLMQGYQTATHSCDFHQLWVPLSSVRLLSRDHMGGCWVMWPHHGRGHCYIMWDQPELSWEEEKVPVPLLQASQHNPHQETVWICHTELN